MGFWRKEVIDPALDHETQKHIQEQLEWIAREPGNSRPYYHLAQLYRVQYRQDEALALLLEAVRLDPRLAEAHSALTEVYAVRSDYAAAWKHARIAEELGAPQCADLLRRHGVRES